MADPLTDEQWAVIEEQLGDVGTGEVVEFDDTDLDDGEGRFGTAWMFKALVEDERVLGSADRTIPATGWHCRFYVNICIADYVAARETLDWFISSDRDTLARHSAIASMACALIDQLEEDQATGRSASLKTEDRSVKSVRRGLASVRDAASESVHRLQTKRPAQRGRPAYLWRDHFLVELARLWVVVLGRPFTISSSGPLVRFIRACAAPVVESLTGEAVASVLVKAREEGLLSRPTWPVRRSKSVGNKQHK